MRRNLKAGSTQSGGFRLSAMTLDEISDIHRSTLEVLNETGVFIQNVECREVMKKAGCRVNNDTAVVRIPAHLVEDAIISAPETIILKGRTKDKDVVLEPGRVGFTNFGEAVFVVDMDTGEVRETMKSDVADVSRLVDALDIIDVFERPAGAHDAPAHTAAVHMYHAMVTNCTKHVVIGPLTVSQAKKLQEMARIIITDVYGAEEAVDRIPMSFACSPVSPLRLVDECCAIIRHAAYTNTSINIIPVAMGGGSAPVNMAGNLVTHNAEVLSGIVLAQLCNRGLPVIYGCSSTCLDLRDIVASCGAPEMGMLGAAVATMARYYKLPCWTAGL